MKITFNAFSFLKGKLENNGVTCGNANMELKNDISINQLIQTVNLEDKEVEAVFVNHKIVPKNTLLKEGDRVALVPPGGIPNHVKAYVGDTK
jgi:sulfur carrier protein ThiS